MRRHTHPFDYLALLFAVAAWAQTTAHAQNLLANGSFESYSTLPSGYGESYLAIGWGNVNGNYAGSPFGSPDYAHALGFNGGSFAPLTAAEGQAQMGFTAWHSSLQDFREYVSCGLSSPLVPGATYQVNFFLSSGDVGSIYTFGCDHVGITFSVGPLNQSQSEVINAEPQCEITEVASLSGIWQQYQFSFTPAQAFDRLTIGNFRTDSETSTTITGSLGAYYFIDNISVTQVGAAGQAENDRSAPRLIGPNPTDGPITITAEGDMSNTVVTVLNMAGQEMVSQRGPASRSMSIDLGTFPAGQYAVNVRTPEGTRTHRVTRR